MTEAANNKRPVPTDFVEVATGKSIAEIVKLYRCAVRTAARWRKECGIEPLTSLKPPLRSRAVPDDFEFMCRSMTVNQLSQHYSTGRDTVKRWLQKTSTKAKQVGPSALGRMGRPSYGCVAYTKNKSIYDEAADTLRADRWVVFRCDEKGQYAQAGAWYRVGQTICEPSELLERAERCRQRRLAKL